MKSKKVLDWKEVYKLPLKQDEYAPFMVWTADRQRAFDFSWPGWEDYDNANIPESVQQLIINKLNGNSSIIIKEIYNFSYDDGDIYAYSLNSKEKCHILMIRGWGHLTGCGALNLSNEVAAKIQDDFGKYICETLNH